MISGLKHSNYTLNTLLTDTIKSHFCNNYLETSDRVFRVCTKLLAHDLSLI